MSAENLGSGRRHKARVADLTKKGAKSPKGLAASIARAKYGSRADELAAAGRRRTKAEGEAGAARIEPPAKPRTGRVKV